MKSSLLEIAQRWIRGWQLTQHPVDAGSRSVGEAPTHVYALLQMLVQGSMIAAIYSVSEFL